MEPLLLLAFAAILITCVLSGHSMFIALFAGWVMFFGYGLHKGKSVKQMLPDCADYLYAYRHAYRGMAFLRSYCLYCV